MFPTPTLVHPEQPFLDQQPHKNTRMKKDKGRGETLATNSGGPKDYPMPSKKECAGNDGADDDGKVDAPHASTSGVAYMTNSDVYVDGVARLPEDNPEQTSGLCVLGNGSVGGLVLQRKDPPTQPSKASCQGAATAGSPIVQDGSPIPSSVARASITTEPTVQRNEAPTGDEGIVLPLLNEHDTMARALGLAGCDFQEAPYNKHKRLCTPTRSELYAEFQRRLGLFGIKVGRENRLLFPTIQSDKETVIDWLKNNPIQDQQQVLQLQTLASRLRDRIANAPRVPRKRAPRAPRKSAPRLRSKRAGPEEDKRNSSSNNGSGSNERALFSNTGGVASASLANDGNGNMVFANTTDRASAGLMHASQDGELTPMDLMARVLGLPGCDYQQDPLFKHFQWTCHPTKQHLLVEVKRRFERLDVNLTKSERTLHPGDHTNKPGLVKWLRDNPIPSNDPVVKGLLSQVEQLRTRLQSQIESTRKPPPPRAAWSKLKQLHWSDNDASDNDECMFDTLDGNAADRKLKDDATDPSIEPPLKKKRNTSQGLSDEAKKAAAKCFDVEVPRDTSNGDGTDMESLSSSLMKVSVSTISDCPSMLTGDQSTLTSSEGNSGLTTSSVARVRGGGASFAAFRKTRIVNLPLVVSGGRKRKRDDASMSALSGCRTSAFATIPIAMEDTESLATLEKESGNSVPKGGKKTEQGLVDTEGRIPTKRGISHPTEVEELQDRKAPTHEEKDGSNDEDGDSRAGSTKQETLRRQVWALAEKDDISGLVGLMEKHREEANIQANACSALRDLALSGTDTKQKIQDAGGVAMVVSAMQQHEGSIDVQQEASAALSTLAKDFANESISEGIILLLRCMRKHKTIVSVQIKAGSALSNLAEHSDNRELIVAENGIPIILDAMKAHLLDANVQASACAALSQLARHEYNRKRIEEVGGISDIVNAMKKHPKVTDVQEQGCFVLQRLSRDSDNKKLIIAAQGISAIVLAMEEHESVAAVQHRGSGALWNLSTESEYQKAIGEAGGVSVILHAMRQYSLVADVQRLGCGSLGNIAVQDDNKERIVAGEGITLIVAAMQQHHSDPDVQEEGCRALGGLASGSDTHRKLVAAADGISVVVRAMEQHQGRADVQAYGCVALAQLAADNAENQESIGAADVMSLIVAAMQRHNDDAKVQKEACFALGTLTYGMVDNARLAADTGAIPLIACAMERHELVADVQESGCFAFWCLALSQDDNIKKCIVEAKGVAVVVGAMQKHGLVAEVQTYACWALGSLAQNNAENQEAIAGSEGIFSFIVGAMERHESDADVQDYACYVLDELFLWWKKDESIARKVRESVARAQRNFPDRSCAKYLANRMQ